MIGLLGYGRYNDDPKHVGCPRAKSDMTPCIARDGQLALASASGGSTCVGCDRRPGPLLRELQRAAEREAEKTTTDAVLADQLRALVYIVTEPGAGGQDDAGGVADRRGVEGG